MDRETGSLCMQPQGWLSNPVRLRTVHTLYASFRPDCLMAHYHETVPPIF